MSQPPAEPRPFTLLIASFSCWFWGILIGVLQVGQLVPEIQVKGTELILVIIFALLAVAYCVAAYLLSNASRLGGWIAMIATALLCTLLLIRHHDLFIVGLMLVVVILAILVPFLAVSWPYLRTPRKGGGA